MTTHTPIPTTLVDPRCEAALLNSYGLKYVEREVPIGEIDFEHSQNLNGREETRANQDKIDEYAIKMLDGEDFPYVVLAHDNLRRKFLIWSGVHRVGAKIEVKAPTVHAFVVEITPAANPETLAKLKAFAAESNVRHGYATSNAERLHAAADEYENGVDLAEIGSRFALSGEEILKKVHERKLNFELRQHGLRPELIVRISDKEAILRAPDEPCMRDLAAFIQRNTIREKGEVAKFRVTQGEVNSLVTALRREKSPAERAKLFDAADAAAQAGKPKHTNGKVRKDPRTSQTFVWKGCVTRLTREFDERELVKAAVTGDQLDDILNDIKAVRGVMDAVERLIDRQR